MITLAETDSAPWQPRPSASRTGIVVFRSSAASMRQLTWRGRQGDHLGIVGSPDLDWQVELSPLTGTRAVLVRGGPWPEDRDLWLADLESGIPSKLTTRPGLESSPVWSPDERRIAYHSSQGGGAIAPFVKDLDSGREEQQLRTDRSLVSRGLDRRRPFPGVEELRVCRVRPPHDRCAEARTAGRHAVHRRSTAGLTRRAVDRV